MNALGIAVILSAIGFGSMPAQAAVDPRLDLLWIGESAYSGLEASFTLGLEPFPDRWVNLGPRISYFRSFEADGQSSYASFGAEGVIWLANALGLGAAGDLKLNTPTGYRGELFTSIRLKHFRSTGAWGVRLGTLWDSHERWAFRAGISLQLGGVNEP